MKILITGANGQLGKTLTSKLQNLYSITALSKSELDITKKEEVEKIISKLKPQQIIHSAAFTTVDQCEVQPTQAYEVNALGTSYVALAANQVGARVIYISSDYVFDGEKQTPYQEVDSPNPQSIYGMSKWLGEKFVLQFNQGMVLRTSWLYGHDGKNFVKTMLELAKRQKKIQVVNDQIGSPTYVNDLSETILQLLNKKSRIYHVSNTGFCTWYEFAKLIFKEAGFNPDFVLPTTTEEYKALAPRPRYSVLGHNALYEEKVSRPRHWEEALKEFIRKEIGI